MPFGLLIIGDEILSGKRADQHFAKVRELLAARGLQLTWVEYLGDDPARLTNTLMRSFASDDVVFSCGGIGATPDDHTRQSAARALNLPLLLHPEAERLIRERSAEVGLPPTPGRLQMGEFPQGADIIPNPYNRIPGFSLRQHWFVPGFPDMAWPMLEWVLDTHYSRLFHAHANAERSRMVYGLAEATLTPLMQQIEQDFTAIKVFSLPRLNPQRYEIELGVKGDPDQVDAAFDLLMKGARELGAQVQP